MPRYSSISLITDPNKIPTQRYRTTKYPEIERDFEDIYVFTTQKDRYDMIANTYYGDASLWWIISSANPTYVQDSLIPPIGIQLRIPAPSRVPTIIANFDLLNNIN